MPIYEMTADSLKPIPATRYEDNDIKERGDLQRLLRDNIEVVSPDTLIIAEEFGEFADSRRRIDLLGVDRQGNLVVIELKRTEDGGHMDLQAIRYASMVANMLVSEAVGIYGKYLKSKGLDQDAKSSLYKFLGWENEEEEEEETFANDVRIVLVSAEFSKELTTSVLWLNSRELDIRCVKMAPYKDGNRILVDVQEVIPLPEAADYQTRIELKEQAERKARMGRNAVFAEFWSQLQQYANSVSRTHSRITPRERNNFSAGSGVSGLQFVYSVQQQTNWIEVYICVSGDISQTKRYFDCLLAKKEAIDRAFGGGLEWERKDGESSSQILFKQDGGYLAERAEWPEIHKKMVDAMARLEGAVKPYLADLH
jgi:hypothetical protein